MIVISVLVEISKGLLPNISYAPVCVRVTLVVNINLSFSDNYSFDRLVLPEFLSYFSFPYSREIRNVFNIS